MSAAKSTDKDGSKVLGRRLAILEILHRGPVSRETLYEELLARGYTRYAPSYRPSTLDAVQSEKSAYVRGVEAKGEDYPPMKWMYALRQDLEALRVLGYEVGYNQQTGLYEWSKGPDPGRRNEAPKIHSRRKDEHVLASPHIYFFVHLNERELNGLRRLRHLFRHQTPPIGNRGDVEGIDDVRHFLERIVRELPPEQARYVGEGEGSQN